MQALPFFAGLHVTVVPFPYLTCFFLEKTRLQLREKQLYKKEVQCGSSLQRGWTFGLVFLSNRNEAKGFLFLFCILVGYVPWEPLMCRTQPIHRLSSWLCTSCGIPRACKSLVFTRLRWNILESDDYYKENLPNRQGSWETESERERASAL